MVVTNTATGVQQANKTDQDGVFAFPVLSVGPYQIEVTSEGFRDYRKTSLVIDIDSPLVVDVTLQVKEQDQSITVTEDAAQVETTDTQHELPELHRPFDPAVLTAMKSLEATLDTLNQCSAIVQQVN